MTMDTIMLEVAAPVPSAWAARCRPEYFSKVTEWIPDSIAVASLGSLPG
jgi:hypothetical protein